MSIQHDLSLETLKATPPLAVTSAMIMGISVSDWAAILTIIYVLLQIFFLLRKKHKESVEEKAAKARKLAVASEADDVT